MLDRAANAPRWVVVVLAVTIVAITAVVAGHRHLTPLPTPVADAVPARTPAAAAGASSDAREPLASRDFDRTATREVEQRVRPSIPIVRKPIPTVPVASSDAAETVASAEASTYNIPGQCLGWAREQADIPSRYSTAATAWDHATGRHPHDVTPPKGAAVYWTGGSAGAGHIAISVGHGRVRSSDAGGSGVVATISLSRLTREWHLTYVGWADSINGYRIPGVART
ncbi:hypothetical protein ASC77_17150 [Nocardioides sp. Root1257]|uniref:CHAP domain-containing protein n=1 Tax=unclassified Nocardioides TaxID=2615069 RepID=UPI0006F8B116|nr:MULTISPECIES: CHAP domain-containing protein [unclassified Nocardioides]KQW46924.1 hypothetical protein ASC77_17150 [Nocardioides sp. Root1257]KRC43671.1 hypothetical protein ASE24_18105 [Nocardioides sp. Root224]